MNLAALWNLPLLFVVENNHYAQTTPIGLAVAGSIEARPQAFGIPTAEFDTTHVGKLHAAAGAAIETVRSSGGPFALVLETYRFSPHSKGDEVRDPDEIAARRAHDPLVIIADDLDPARATEIAAAVERRVSEACAVARAMPAAGLAAS
jgi:TPP-dependent pyruvate/acetoin dehydrogenase alpha subunit